MTINQIQKRKKLQGFLFQRIGLIARAYATKFIQIQTQECLKTTKTIHHRKMTILFHNQCDYYYTIIIITLQNISSE